MGLGFSELLKPKVKIAYLHLLWPPDLSRPSGFAHFVKTKVSMKSKSTTLVIWDKLHKRTNISSLTYNHSHLHFKAYSTETWPHPDEEV